MPLLRRLLEKRDLFAASSLIPPPWADGPIADAGVLVTEENALRASAVWASVSLISDAVSTLPADAFRRTNGARIPIEPVPRLLLEPHAEMDRPDWTARLMVSLLLRGNAYGLILEEDRAGFPTQILPIHPDRVSVDRNRQTGLVEYQMRGDGTDTHLAWPGGDMWHVRGLTLPGRLTGLSPIEFARQSIGLALAAERFGSRFFGDNATPGGVLKVPQRLTPEQAEALKIEWERAHGGGRRRPAVLGGGIEWQNISMTNDDAQFLQTRSFQTAEIARIFRVPTHLIGDATQTTVWGTGVEQLGLAFVTYTLQPWLVRLETALSKLLPRPQFVRFNVAGLLRADLTARYNSYAVGRNAGFLSVNEIRALEDLQPLENPRAGDTYLQALNLVGISGERPERAPEAPEMPAELIEGLGMPAGPVRALDGLAGSHETAAVLAEIRHAEELEQLRRDYEGRLAGLRAGADQNLAARDEELIRLRAGRKLIVHRDADGLAEAYEEVIDGESR